MDTGSATDSYFPACLPIHKSNELRIPVKVISDSAAFFKIVVACINYAATLLFSGFRFTDFTGVQLRVLHDHRVGFSNFFS